MEPWQPKSLLGLHIPPPPQAYTRYTRETEYQPKYNIRHSSIQNRATFFRKYPPRCFSMSHSDGNLIKIYRQGENMKSVVGQNEARL